MAQKQPAPTHYSQQALALLLRQYRREENVKLTHAADRLVLSPETLYRLENPAWDEADTQPINDRRVRYFVKISGLLQLKYHALLEKIAADAPE